MGTLQIWLTMASALAVHRVKHRPERDPVPPDLVFQRVTASPHPGDRHCIFRTVDGRTHYINHDCIERMEWIPDEA